MSYWSHLEHHWGAGRSWMEEPLVQARINRRVTGREDRRPIDWIAGVLETRGPFERVVSVGCGTGALERDLVRRRIVGRILGLDVATPPLEEARRQAAAAGLDDRIAYAAADARKLLAGFGRLDAVFFHQSLHHFDRLDDLLGRASAALRPGGSLVLDEYVERSMDRWSWRSLLLPNLFYRLLPGSVRRTRIVRAPVNPDDPTEAVCAGEILDRLEPHFRIVGRRDYGGNLTAITYPNLRRPGDGAPGPRRAVYERSLAFLLDAEDRLMRLGLRSAYTVLVAEPRGLAVGSGGTRKR